MEQQHEGHSHWHPDGIDGQRNINWPKLLANPSIFTINQGPLQLTEHEKLLQRQLLQIKRTTVWWSKSMVVKIKEQGWYS